MNSNVKKISPVLFVAASLLFLMPFLSVSCNNQKVFTLAAIQLVTGTEVQQTGGFGGRESQHIDPEPFTIAVFVMIIAGIAFGFLKGKSSAVLSTMLSIASFILLLLFKNKTDAEVLQKGQGMFQVEYEIGFWLIAVVMVFAAMFNTFLLLAKTEQQN